VTEVRAIGVRTTNAVLIEDLHTLGWLRDEDLILDPTFGNGRWWTRWSPSMGVYGTDIRPVSEDVGQGNFLHLPWREQTWDVVAFDPPYKLNGRPSRGGPASLDNAYGVGGELVVRWQDRMELCMSGIDECARVCKRILLVKCMDQVCSGEVRWQTHKFTDRADKAGFRLVDKLHINGYRKQPGGRDQVHARRDYSTMLVLERKR
jgi:hypothetical protein